MGILLISLFILYIGTSISLNGETYRRNALETKLALSNYELNYTKKYLSDAEQTIDELRTENIALFNEKEQFKSGFYECKGSK